MNKIYSISPELFTTANELGFTLNSFGFYKGRYLAQLPKNWLKMVYESTYHLPDVEKKRINSILNKKKNSLLKLSLPYESSKSWLDNSIELLQNNQLDGVITNQPIESESIFTVADIIDGNLPSTSGIQISSTSKNIIKQMEVILKSSQEVYLVDPYLSLGSKKYTTFLSDLIKHPDVKDTTFRIFSKKQHFDTKESFESLCNRHLRDGLIQGCELCFYPIEDAKDMHGRYIFSIHGGLKYDKGFQVDNETVVDIEVMTEKIHELYFDKYNSYIKSNDTSRCFPAT